MLKKRAVTGWGDHMYKDKVWKQISIFLYMRSQAGLLRNGEVL